MIFRRVMAFFIDITLTSIPGVFSYYFLFKSSRIDVHPIVIILTMHLLVSSLMYFHTRSSSVGQHLLHLKVVNMAGEKCDYAILFFRNLAFCVALGSAFFSLITAFVFIVGVLGVYVSSNSQTMFDVVFRSRVVNERNV